MRDRAGRNEQIAPRRATPLLQLCYGIPMNRHLRLIAATATKRIVINGALGESMTPHSAARFFPIGQTTFPQGNEGDCHVYTYDCGGLYYRDGGRGRRIGGGRSLCWFRPGFW